MTSLLPTPRFGWQHWVLVCLIDVLGPFSTDSYIPNLSSMRHELNTTSLMAGLTLQLNWLSKGLATLAIGSVADRRGRRRALIIAFFFYLIGATGCALTPIHKPYGIYWLICCRIIQGIGESGTTVCTAITRDVIHDPQKRLRVLTLISSLRIAAIAVSPTVGGIIGVAFGWRMLFAGLAICGALLFLTTVLFLPETLHLKEQTKAGADESWMGVFNILTSSPSATGALLANTVSFAALLSYLSNVSIILEDYFHKSTLTTSYLMGSVAAVFVVVNIGLSAVLKYSKTPISPFTLLNLSVAISLCATAMCFVFALTGRTTLVAILATSYVFEASASLGFGAASTIYIQPFADVAGKASALILIVRTVFSTVLAQLSVDVVDEVGVPGFFYFVGGTLFFMLPSLYFINKKESELPSRVRSSTLANPLLEEDLMTPRSEREELDDDYSSFSRVQTHSDDEEGGSG